MTSPEPVDNSVSPLAWPVPVAGGIAAVWAAVSTLLAFSVSFSILWVFTADPRTSFGAAVRAATALWMLGHSVPLGLGGLTISLTPLLVTLLLVWVLSIATRWAVRNSIVLNLAGSLGLVGSIAGGYALIGGLVSLWLAPVVQINSSRALVGCFAWALVGCSWGMWRSRNETGPVARRNFARAGERTRARIRVQSPARVFGRIWTDLPNDVREGLKAGSRSFLIWLLAASVLTVGLIGWRLADAMQLGSTMAPDFIQRVELALATAAYLPTLVGWVTAMLLGPGFIVGGGNIGLFAQQTAALPAFPLFAFLPAPLPNWAVGLLAVPVLIAALGMRGLWAARAWRAMISYVAVLALWAGLVSVATRGDFGGGRFLGAGPRPMQVALAAALISVVGGIIVAVLERLGRGGRSQTDG